jgi:hypothetical protein
MKPDAPDNEGCVLKVRAFARVVIANLQDLEFFSIRGQEVFAIEVLVFPYQL